MKFPLVIITRTINDSSLTIQSFSSHTGRLCVHLLVSTSLFILAVVLLLFLSFLTEIAKVRASLFQINGTKKDPLVLPEGEGPPTTLTEKVFVPVKDHPDVSTSTRFVVVRAPVSFFWQLMMSWISKWRRFFLQLDDRAFSSGNSLRLLFPLTFEFFEFESVLTGS